MHNDFEIGWFLVLRIKQLARANRNFPFKTGLLVLLPSEGHSLKLEKNTFIWGTEYFVLIFNAQPIERRLYIFFNLLGSWHSVLFIVFHISLPGVAQARNVQEFLLLLLLHEDLYLFKKLLSQTVGLKYNFDFSHFIWLESTIHGDVWDGSCRIGI